MTVIGQEFSKNIRDGKGTIRVAPERLDGLPQDWLDEHPVEDDGLVTVTTDYPDAIPVRTFCKRPRRTARDGRRVPQPGVPARTSRSSASCSSCARSSPGWSATTPGPTTTPA